MAQRNRKAKTNGSARGLLRDVANCPLEHLEAAVADWLEQIRCTINAQERVRACLWEFPRYIDERVIGAPENRAAAAR